jgi:XisH protein
MPARDLYHDAVKNALVKDGWTITHDPFRLPVGIRDSFVDLGAQKLVAAEKGPRKIAVEIKSFLSSSLLQDLETALGQFTLYRAFLRRMDPDRTLYLALPEATMEGIYADKIADVLFDEKLVETVTFDPDEEVIVRWIP